MGGFIYYNKFCVVPRRNHANTNLNVWSNNDYSTGPIVNPVFLVLLVSVTFITTLEILVVSKSPGIRPMDSLRVNVKCWFKMSNIVVKKCQLSNLNLKNRIWLQGA